METISYGAIEMDCYELYDRECEAIATKWTATHDKSDGHPEPLKDIAQDPDGKRARAGRIDDRKGIKGYCPHEHLEHSQPRNAYCCCRLSIPKGRPGKLQSWRRTEGEMTFPSRTTQRSWDRKR